MKTHLENIRHLRIANHEGNRILFWHFKPKSANGKLIIYCHGGFGGVGLDNSLVRKVARFRHLRYHVAVIFYPGENISGGWLFPNIHKDWKEVKDLAHWFTRNENIWHIDLIGVSRGGYVALEAFGRRHPWFDSCIVSVAPTDIPSWFETTSLPRWWQRTYGRYFSHSPIDLAEEMANSDKFVGLLYGLRDNIVPVKQGTWLHNRLMAYGKQTETHIDNQGNHAMIIKPSNWRVLVEWVLKNGG